MSVWDLIGKGPAAAVKLAPLVVKHGKVVPEVWGFLSRNQTNLETLLDSLETGIFPIREDALNSYIAEGVEESSFEEARLKCGDGVVTLSGKGRKYLVGFKAAVKFRFSRSRIDQETRSIELALLDDIEVKGRGVLGTAVVAVLGYFLKDVMGGSWSGLVEAPHEAVTVAGRRAEVDLDKIEKVKKALDAGVGNLSILDFVHIAGIRPVKGAIEIDLEKGYKTEILRDIWKLLKKLKE